MTVRPSKDLVLGLVLVGLSLLAIFVWIPLDTDTGIIERVRSRTVIGDAMAPTIAAALLGIAAVAIMVRRLAEPLDVPAMRQTLAFAAGLVATLLLSTLVMRWTGPAAVAIVNGLGGDLPEYRLLRATPPWTYLGYLAGGTVLIATLVALIERRITWKHVLVAFLVSLALAAFYGLPFDDLLLPPNGDV